MEFGVDILKKVIVRNNPYRYADVAFKIKNFDKVFKEKQELELRLSDVAPQHELFTMLADLQKQIKPVAKFFSATVEPQPEPAKRLTKKQKEQKELDDHYAMLNQQLLTDILKNKG